MKTQIPFTILPQPTETTCGPTCLHAVYNYYGDTIALNQVIEEIHAFDDGGTLAVFLAAHALKRGYSATIYTYNLQVFDPTWFNAAVNIKKKLQAQAQCKTDSKLRTATQGYLEFLDLGGKLKFVDLNGSLLRKYLKKNIPIITGLSATYLHRTAREIGDKCQYDDIRGNASGHFVVLCGYDQEERTISLAEPLHPNPICESQYYSITIDRIICSILLGILTYDANILIIERNVETRHG